MKVRERQRPVLSIQPGTMEESIWELIVDLYEYCALGVPFTTKYLYLVSPDNMTKMQVRNVMNRLKNKKYITNDKGHNRYQWHLTKKAIKAHVIHG